MPCMCRCPKCGDATLPLSGCHCIVPDCSCFPLGMEACVYEGGSFELVAPSIRTGATRSA